MNRQRADHNGRPFGALDRLRLRITIWYVATCAAILLVLGAGLFFVVAAQIGGELDRRLDEATRALAGAGGTPRSRLLVPGVELSVTDSLGRSLQSGGVRPSVEGVARRAAREGTAAAELPAAEEHVLRVRARAFRARTGDLRVAVAEADLEDLEDRYLLLITQFVVAAVVALAFVTVGGLFLGRKFARPVEETVEHMRQFMSDAAHELRTPVTVLRTESEVAFARRRDERDDEAAFRRIASNAMRLADVVDDLFILARAESGELPVEHSAVFIDDLVSDVVSALGSVAVRRGIALRLGDFEEAPVLGSAPLLRRVIGILLDNALKYTGTGGEVTASTRATARVVMVEVTDTGIGIAAEAMPHVFDRFYRTDAARESGPGTGLGLAIARHIAEMHDGKLTIESAQRVGTTARLTLPRRLAGGSPCSEAEPAPM